ncbi:MAG: winged helix-turn-helix transcriptional regulator [Rubrivivax sp.]|nr:winged helix-turn-helix transcriptional regulator [Rubrivivax sp.]
MVERRLPLPPSPPPSPLSPPSPLPPLPPLPPPSPLPPRGCTNLKLRQLSRLVARHYEGFVGPTGLKNTQYSLLSYVVKLGACRAGELAAAMKLDASTLSRNLQPLVDKGLVEVGVGDDLRSRIVAPTIAGQALRDEGQRAWKRAQLALNARLGEARVVALHALLDEAMQVLEEPGPA